MESQCDSDVEPCGLLGWIPKWIQRFATPIMFLISMCMLTFSDAFFFGALAGVATSLETRYKLSATQIGLFFTVYVVGVLVVLLFVAYVGGHSARNRPRWIAWGMVVNVIGIVIVMLPQFISGAYEFQQSDSDEKEFSSICLNDRSINNTFHVPCLEKNPDIDLRGSDKLSYALLCFGMFISGVGFAPVFPLGFAYIDDNAPQRAGLYLGMIKSMYGIGIIIGLLVAAAVLQIEVDFYRTNTIELKPGDSDWVGAWWAAIAVTGVLFLVSTLSFFFYPRRLPNSRTIREADQNEGLRLDDKEEKIAEDISNNTASREESILDLLRSIYRLLQNPTYVSLCLSAICEKFLAGLHTLFPKYFEEQFSISPAKANVIIALGPVPGIFVGSILGGYLLKKFKIDAIGATKLAFTTLVIGIVLGIGLLCVGCQQTNFAGITTAYHSNNSASMSLWSSCNTRCGCHIDDYAPVCGSDNLTYFSACHAGCVNTLNESTYTNCTCVSSEVNHGEIERSQDASDGVCASPCQALIPFTILLVIFVMDMNIFPICRIFITIRCVDYKDKSLAIGFSSFVTYILGAIPSTLAIGAIIDSTCSFWQTDTCGVRGACLVYDINKYRHYYLGFNVAVTVLITLCFALTWIFLLKQQKKTVKESRAPKK